MHSHRYNYNLPTRQRSATATPEIDPSEQFEGLSRTLDGQRALLEILNEAHIFAGQHMTEEFVADLTQDLLAVAAFLNEEAQRELVQLWDAVKDYKRQRAQQLEENPLAPHDTATEQNAAPGSEQEG